MSFRKILHKGKVLFPLASYTESDQEEKERELSQKLLEISSSSSTPSLLVVGTPTQTQNDWLENEERERQRQQLRERTEHKDLWTVVTTLTVQDIVRFGRYVLLYSFHFTLGVVRGCWDLVRSKLFGGSGTNDQRNHEHSD